MPHIFPNDCNNTKCIIEVRFVKSSCIKILFEFAVYYFPGRRNITGIYCKDYVVLGARLCYQEHIYAFSCQAAEEAAA